MKKLAILFSLVLVLAAFASADIYINSKTYLESPLPFDMTKLLDPQMAQMMSQMMKMTVTVAPNNQTKTVGQWKCAGYDVALNMMMTPMKMSAWASTEVPLAAA